LLCLCASSSRMEPARVATAPPNEACTTLTDALFVELRHTVLELLVEQRRQLERYHIRVEEQLAGQEEVFRGRFAGLLTPVLESTRDTCQRATAMTIGSRDTSNASLWDEGKSDSLSVRRQSFASKMVSTQAWGPTREQIASRYNVQVQRTKTLLDVFVVWGNLNTERLHQRRLRLDWLMNFVAGRVFMTFVGFIVVINGVFLGIVSNNTIKRTIDEYHKRGTEAGRFVLDIPDWESSGEVFFAIVFTIELVLRLFAEEFQFFTGIDKLWNYLDLFLVVASWSELTLTRTALAMSSFSYVRLLRLLRLIRTLRGIRVLRMFQVFGKFRVLLLAIRHSVVPFTWACVLLFWMLYIVSIVFLNGVAEYVGGGDTDSDVVDGLQTLFGSLDWALLTLFMSVTGGLSWEIAMRSLLEVHLLYGIFFVVFVAAMVLAALNIVAGIFVNDAIEVAQMDRDLAVSADASRNKAIIFELMELFREFDTDGSGTLSCDELVEAWKNPAVSARFRMLGVGELIDAASLFDTLDVNGANEVEIEEFVTGCLRVKALARPIDLQYFMQENKRNVKRERRHVDRLERHMLLLSMKLDDIGQVLQQGDSAIHAHVLRESAMQATPRSIWHGKRLTLEDVTGRWRPTSPSSRGPSPHAVPRPVQMRDALLPSFHQRILPPPCPI